MITQYRNKKTIFLFIPSQCHKLLIYSIKASAAQQQHFEQSRSFFFNVCLQEINNPVKKMRFFQSVAQAARKKKSTLNSCRTYNRLVITTQLKETRWS